MRWAGHAALMGERTCACRILVGKPEGKRPLGEPSLDERIVLKWMFEKWDGGDIDRI
jgi:hypothetical protein